MTVSIDLIELQNWEQFFASPLHSKEYVTYHMRNGRKQKNKIKYNPLFFSSHFSYAIYLVVQRFAAPLPFWNQILKTAAVLD
jgi:hypothetical protein